MEEKQLDDLGRLWEGDKDYQRDLVDRLWDCLKREHPIDVASACGAIMAMLICDRAPNLEAALAGLRAHHGDLEVGVRAHFANKTRQ